MSKQLQILQNVLSVLLFFSLLGILYSFVWVYCLYRPEIQAKVASVKATMLPEYSDYVPTELAFLLPLTNTSTAPPTLTLAPTKPHTLTPARTFTPTATVTATFTPPPTLTLTWTPKSTRTPKPTRTRKPPEPTQAQQWPPDQAQIDGLVGHWQTSSLDCESRAATDLAAFFGVNFDEMEFQSRLPSSDDPNQGFVGNYWDPTGQLPPRSYGVYSGPVAELLRGYGLNVYESHGTSWDAVRGEIASGRPMMVWVINNTLFGYPVSYTPSNGNTTTVARYEHTVIVTGYNADIVTIVDGGMVYYRSIQQFQDSWSVLGNMAVMVADPAKLSKK